ncbi:hypothetical protein B0H13DRAFT_2332369 [Mycena leptocephala]|nr:hypothetical protein B0H13DRAFT_2332369 [Mycena leptocephala]
MSIFRCAVPFYPDPGQPDSPSAYNKTYLVTGRLVKRPGAYGSWTSADIQYKSVSAVTVKGYKSWHALECAWFAGCDRGEHAHPAGPTPNGRAPSSPTPSPLPLPSSLPPSPSMPPSLPLPSPSSPTSRLRSPADSPSLHIHSRSESIRSVAVSSTLPPSPPASPCPPARLPHTPLDASVADAPPTLQRRAKADRARPSWLMAYAVRSNGQGVVFGSYEQARGLYHQLQAQGHDASLAASPSLTDSVSFVEGFPVGGSSVEATRRRAWIHEEYDARQRRLIDTWRDTSGTDGGESDAADNGVDSDDSWSSESSEDLTEVEG